LLILALWHSALTWFEHVSSGGLLAEQLVVRHRLAEVGALLESLTVWVEQFAFMMPTLPHQQADVLLGGPTALLKAQAGMVFKKCADTAVLLFGSNEYTRPGPGQPVESDSPILLLDTYLPATNDTAA
jgi:acyl-CoA dehydrogenase